MPMGRITAQHEDALLREPVTPPDDSSLLMTTACCHVPVCLFDHSIREDNVLRLHLTAERAH